MPRRITVAERRKRRLTHLTPEDHEQADHFIAEIERDRAFPRDDPPRVEAHYRRTWSPWRSDDDLQLLEFAFGPGDSTQRPGDDLRHEVLRSAFYDALYAIGRGLADHDEAVRVALDELEHLASLICAGDPGLTNDTTDGYGLESKPGSGRIAKWLKRHGLAEIPLIGPDILASIDAVIVGNLMRRPAPFRLRVYAHEPAQTLPRGWQAHTAGEPALNDPTDPDAIDITIRGSWRQNARTQSMAEIRKGILAEIEQLLDRELGPIIAAARDLGVRPNQSTKRELHMRWLVLYHFPDSYGIFRTPEEVGKRERELRDPGATGPLDVENDSVHDAAAGIATKLGLKLQLKRGRPSDAK